MSTPLVPSRSNSLNGFRSFNLSVLNLGPEELGLGWLTSRREGSGVGDHTLRKLVTEFLT